jgi:predicted amidophosphoribosyltransferase
MYYETYQDYLDSEEWAEKCRLVALRSGGVCERCEQHNAAHVHHKRYPRRWGTEPISWLQHLCVGCHAWVHGKSQVDPKDYGSDHFGYMQAVLAEL